MAVLTSQAYPSSTVATLKAKTVATCFPVFIGKTSSVGFSLLVRKLAPVRLVSSQAPKKDDRKKGGMHLVDFFSR
ncbi:unnamed protein product [Amoebophrya sp. A25]|nr:unnamed protein product [Amoebophrya sp. A25]|eukprot:GSA25T00026437001.1